MLFKKVIYILYIQKNYPRMLVLIHTVFQIYPLMQGNKSIICQYYPYTHAVCSFARTLTGFINTVYAVCMYNTSTL